MTDDPDFPCHCPTKAEHDDRLARAVGTSDLAVIADAREYLRLHFQGRKWGEGSAREQLPSYVLDRIERWAS